MSMLDRLIARAGDSGASAGPRGVTRRSFTIGSVAAIGAGMAAISLSSCGSSDVPEATGEPQVVDDSQLIAVLDGDVDTGSFMCGQIAGMVRERQSALEIVDDSGVSSAAAHEPPLWNKSVPSGSVNSCAAA